MYIANIKIMPLANLLDPQGKAVTESLERLGLPNLDNVRIGKHITMEVNAENEEAAKEIAENACKKLLANQVMESFEIEITSA